MGIENFFTFIITALLFIMTPGIDTIYILNKSVGQGKRAGIYSTLGINTGVLVHTLFAALGLSLLVAKSALAFSVLKYAGAAYLIYLGISKVTSKAGIISTANEEQPPSTSRQNFVSGLITNVFNPKVALFFLAFFPQFISRSQINMPTPFILLGVTYAVIGVLWFLLLTFFASLFSERLLSRPSSGKWLNKGSGGVFILMGLKIALSRR